MSSVNVGGAGITTTSVGSDPDKEKFVILSTIMMQILTKANMIKPIIIDLKMEGCRVCVVGRTGLAVGEADGLSGTKNTRIVAKPLTILTIINIVSSISLLIMWF